jgi:hypothetical protein
VKNALVGLVFAIVFLCVLSCGLINRFTNGGVENLQRAEDLWPDVPRMDGLEHSEMEMPMTAKLIMRVMIDNLWRLNKEGEDKTHGDADWVVFSTAKQPADVQNFYTSDRMTSEGGWQSSKKPNCYDGKDKGWPGVLCGYQKKDGGKDVILLILAGQDEKTKRTNIFYVRIETDPSTSNTNSERAK